MQAKSVINDLAIFGGEPLFSSIKPIGQLAQPNPEVFFSYAKRMYEGRRCTNNGPLVRELEERLRDLHGTEYCITFANACLAIVLLMKALTTRMGKVIMPAFTYPGLPHLAQWAGHMPYFCDVDFETHTLDPKSVSMAIEDETAMVLAVHNVNSPCHISELSNIAEIHNVPLFFDSVHGLGCTYGGRPIGGFGKAEVFSLHAAKLLNGFEGGYITTNDLQLTKHLQAARNFGFSGRDRVDSLGMNAKLNEIHAALSLAALDTLSTVISRNRLRYETYVNNLTNISGLHILRYSQDEQCNYEHCLIGIDDTWLITRDELISIFCSEKVLAWPYYSPPLHLSEHCPLELPHVELPVTERLAKRYIQMPMGDLVQLEDIGKIAELFSFLWRHQSEIAQRLPGEILR